ncbi:hypothetical protein [Frateuria defendens]|uniref:hypothetical protein n=1 Tax=Frateuria defendens TaxID=2219559 RepID=UPI0012935E40|nr:hypothetical protein [Frateuria defendens]
MTALHNQSITFDQLRSFDQSARRWYRRVFRGVNAIFGESWRQLIVARQHFLGVGCGYFSDAWDFVSMLQLCKRALKIK